MTETDTLLALSEVTKRYDAPGGGPGEEVLRGVDLRVAEGKSVAVVGPSGSGKSTLLNIIGGLDRPTSGTVWLDGRDMSGLSEAKLAEIRNRQIGFVFQLHHLLPQCTVLENVLIPTMVAEEPLRAEAPARARRLLDRVGMSEHVNHRPGQLSGGQRQRVAVVRALINDPRLVLADEPTGSLDRRHARELGALLAELNRDEAVTLLVVTHSMELAERMGRVLELSDGLLADRASQS